MSSNAPQHKLSGGRARFYHDVQLRGPIPEDILFEPFGINHSATPLADQFSEFSQSQGLSHHLRSDEHGWHRFDWLSFLCTGQTEHHVAAQRLITHWLDAHGQYAPATWRASLSAKRLLRCLMYFDHLTRESDGPFRRRLLDHLARLARHLSRHLRKHKSRTHLEILMAHSFAALAMPEEKAIGDIMVGALESALQPVSEGLFPPSWRQPAEALEFALELTSLEYAFRERRLSPPPSLSEALKVARLYLGGFLSTEDCCAHAPSRYWLSPSALHTVSPPIRPESSQLLSAAGYSLLRADKSHLLIDNGYHKDLSGAGGIYFAVGKTPLITNCGLPTPTSHLISNRMSEWHRAMLSPASSSTYDTTVTSAARSRQVHSGHCTELEFLIDTSNGPIARIFRHSDNDQTLIVNDHFSGPPPNLRLHLPPTTSIVPTESGMDLIAAGGLRAEITIQNASFDTDESISAWTPGKITKSKQVVIRPCSSHIEWGIKWLR